MHLKSTKIWYHPSDKIVQWVDDSTFGMNHSAYAFENKAMFGLNPEKYSNVEKVLDYDGRILYDAMSNGWVRIRTSRRDPFTQTNVEGVSDSAIRKTLKWFMDEIAPLDSVTLVLRTGEGDMDGTPIRLTSADDISRYIRLGVITT